MRNRSVTIYASDENEFKTLIPGKKVDLPNQSLSFSTRKRTSKISSHLESLNNSLNDSVSSEGFHSDSSDDMLGYKTNFSIEVKQPTLREQLVQDEQDLKTQLEQMNLNIHQRLKDQDKESPRTSKPSNVQINGGNYGVNPINKFLKRHSTILKINNNLLCNYNNQSLGINFSASPVKPRNKDSAQSSRATNLYNSSNKINSLTDQSTHDSVNKIIGGGNSQSNDTEDFISQNLHIEEKFVKCILIGDKQVGKTLLRNKILEDNSEPNKTANLEIKKKLIFLQNKAVKMELWDTNVQILNSPIIQTYYKICNGFIFICDINREESIEFITKQIDKALSHKSIKKANCIIIANTKPIPVQKNTSSNKILNHKKGSISENEAQDQTEKNLALLKKISSQQEIKLEFVDINHLEIETTDKEAFSSNSNIVAEFLTELIN